MLFPEDKEISYAETLWCESLSGESLDSDGETHCSEESDSEGSLVDFIINDSEEEETEDESEYENEEESEPDEEEPLCNKRKVASAKPQQGSLSEALSS